MSGVIARGLGLGIALAVLCAGSASAVAPPGPRLAVTRLEVSQRTELFTVAALGGEERTLFAVGAGRTPALAPSYGLSWAPDGARLAFTAFLGEARTRYVSYPKTMIALVSEDGGEVERVAGTAGGFEPVFSPDGRHLAFARSRKHWRRNRKGGVNLVYASDSIWLVDLASGELTQLTPWRNRLTQVPSSFSPDGSRLAFTRIVGGKPPEALAMEFNGSATSVLASNALEPVYSPSGREIAFLRGPIRQKTTRRRTHHSKSVSVVRARFTDLYVRDSGGGGLRRLTRTKNAVEVAPRWDPSGSRLAYAELKPFKASEGIFGFGDAIKEINADGTCPTKILSQRRSVYYEAAWQPGPGREAGPIAC
jgi:Tol biopolymer transport system component